MKNGYSIGERDETDRIEPVRERKDMPELWETTGPGRLVPKLRIRSARSGRGTERNEQTGTVRAGKEQSGKVS